jgi:2-hydroxyglutarate dehydrogenase
MLYDYCTSRNIPYRKTGKLVVANADQQSYVENLHRKAQSLNWPSGLESYSSSPVPTELLSGERARSMEPDLGEDIKTALWVSETGIVDSHAVMSALEKDIEDSGVGDLVYSTHVVRIDRHVDQLAALAPGGNIGEEDGWIVQLTTGDSEEGDGILARRVINAGGLSAVSILNSVLPKGQRMPMYYARGSYASYNGPGIDSISHLIYPCPVAGKKPHGFQSLGTHLTLDLNSRVKFGPDIEWLQPPMDDDEAGEFWTKYLVPDDRRLEEMYLAVKAYLPGVSKEGFQPDYVGIRPKLIPANGGFQDFVIREDFSHANRRRGSSMISLLGIESPGLTSSLAIGRYVVERFIL